MRSRLRSSRVIAETDGRLGAVCNWVVSHLEPQDRFLDIGCGFGWVEQHLLQNSSVENIFALEPDDESFVEFRSRIADPRVKTFVGSALNLPFEDASLDVCLSSEVLEHIPKSTEPQFFSEIARVLRPGGQALITTPNANPLSKFTDPAWWLASHRHYTIESVRAFAEAAGLEVKVSEVRGGWAELGALYDLYISKWVFGRQRIFARRYSSRLSREWTQRSHFQFMGIWLEVVRP